MVTYQSSFGALAMPLPLHTLTPGAREAVEGHKALAAERRVHRMVHGWIDGRGVQQGGLVTKHGRPRTEVWEGDPVTRNARSLLALAEERGFTAQMLVVGAQCVVEGYRLQPERMGFRASWLKGSAGGFAWCAPWRYELVRDERPVGVDKIAHTGKVGYRSPGVDVEHLALVASPWGIKVSYTELVRRVRMVGS